MSLVQHLRVLRAAAGLSQAELANRVGVSRQALNAIERGTRVPSTTLALHLARALDCRVDELFELPSAPSFRATLADPNRTPRRVRVGRIEDRWIAHGVADGSAADGIVTRTVAAPDTADVEPLLDLRRLDANVFVAGCAPLLGVLSDYVTRDAKRGSPSVGNRSTWVPANNERACRLLAEGLVHVAGVHLDNPKSLGRLANRHFSKVNVRCVHLTRWHLGLVLQPGNPLGLRGVGDIAQRAARLIVREAGAGANRLLIAEASTGEPTPTAVARSHQETAQLIQLGIGDVGVAIEAVAIARELEFIPLLEESYDLLVPAEFLQLPHVSQFFDALNGRSFRAEAAAMPGYDLANVGCEKVLAA